MKAVFKFKTKAENLVQVKGKLSHAGVLDLYYFSVAEWEKTPQKILSKIQIFFPEDLLIIRSSAIGEDSTEYSFAGKFESRLGIRRTDSKELTDNINHIISKYKYNPNNQVLVQPMLSSVQVCGVIMTHNHSDGTPYYVINYDDTSGKTDGVTGGTTINKTVYILRTTPSKYIVSPRLQQVLRMAKELEILFDTEFLDIEFALDTENNPFVFQIRPISQRKNQNPDYSFSPEQIQSSLIQYIQTRSNRRRLVLGKKTILGIMPDWNPAEMIGKTPGRLASSLYRYLITKKSWATARHLIGYRNLESEELMVTLAGHPYIDVRNSFNSFLPGDLDETIGEKLVNLWLARLQQFPACHDKVEFEVVSTCHDFSFRQTFNERYGRALSGNELSEYEGMLHKLTLQCLDLSKKGTLTQAMSKVRVLDERQQMRIPIDSKVKSEIDRLSQVQHLLTECIQYGTIPFAIIARHAFIAESLFRSAVQNDAISADRCTEFKQSIPLITNEFSLDFRKVIAGKMSEKNFFQRYGHLRPGTYDIHSLRYADRSSIFDQVISTPKNWA
ncbi:MAG: hypothetical protein WCK53_15400, partial [Methanomicrobiales archaeon]